MAKKLFVGNLDWGVRDDDLREAFASFGELVKAEVVMDKFNPERSRGFGFVEYTTDEAADAAMKEMDGKDLKGHAIRVNEARSEERA